LLDMGECAIQASTRRTNHTEPRLANRRHEVNIHYNCSVVSGTVVYGAIHHMWDNNVWGRPYTINWTAAPA